MHPRERLILCGPDANTNAWVAEQPAKYHAAYARLTRDAALAERERVAAKLRASVVGGVPTVEEEIRAATAARAAVPENADRAERFLAQKAIDDATRRRDALVQDGCAVSVGWPHGWYRATRIDAGDAAGLDAWLAGVWAELDGEGA